ncbi:hypothetical protein BS47DRAFT_1384050 [Hydnum rufescens UP504]|uniref:Protein kinase domain-containing protein n=1 Tax=Hydnum rufescens UP504 TaxID=1448309 RepID=A0A9P6DQN8_9AGAM|nr:hypothetical protein BS47DRAFT_1384050 [Hydnum rufescens UP504]
MPGRLGEYAVLGDIAEGAFGKVKLAIHTLTGQRVALKCIRKATVNAQNSKAKIRVAREIEYLKIVNHPHVIKLYEVINTPTEVILVTEYAGGELFRYIVENRSISEEQARRFFQQIMMAIAYLHSLGIVHRDIKPENVLLDEHTRDVKLADLGLSNEITDGDFLRTWCGSANYAAPEVISNRPYPGPEIDVWSAGVMLYLLVCGRLPFEDDHAPTLYQKIQLGVYELPNWLSPDTKYLISRMLVVDPLKRITVPEILAHPWTHRGLPKYLTRAITALATPSLGNEKVVDGLGKVDQAIVVELADAIGVHADEVMSALNLDGENAVKVAYVICKDRRRSGRELAAIEEEGDGAKKKQKFLADASAVIPTGVSGLLTTQAAEAGVFVDDVEDEDDEDEDEDPILLDGEIDWSEDNHFEFLDSSLVGEREDESNPRPRPHVLLSYERSRSSRGKASLPGGFQHLIESLERERHARYGSHPYDVIPASSPTWPPSRTKIRAPRWNFGIRSSSPPMEVTYELYKSLQFLGAEWREKRHPWSFMRFPYPPQDYDDITPNNDIFFVETRWKLRGHYVRIDIQLYEVHASNYLLDFRNVGHIPIPPSKDPADGNRSNDTQYKITNPFLFLECATSLISHLAEGA